MCGSLNRNLHVCLFPLSLLYVAVRSSEEWAFAGATFENMMTPSYFFAIFMPPSYFYFSSARGLLWLT